MYISFTIMCDFFLCSYLCIFLVGGLHAFLTSRVIFGRTFEVIRTSERLLFEFFLTSHNNWKKKNQ